MELTQELFNELVESAKAQLEADKKAKLLKVIKERLCAIEAQEKNNKSLSENTEKLKAELFNDVKKIAQDNHPLYVNMMDYQCAVVLP